jgi:hypothetical protein
VNTAEDTTPEDPIEKAESLARARGLVFETKIEQVKPKRGHSTTRYIPVPETTHLEWKCNADTVSLRYMNTRLEVTWPDVEVLVDLKDKGVRKIELLKMLGHQAASSSRITALNQFVQAVENGLIEIPAQEVITNEINS